MDFRIKQSAVDTLNDDELLWAVIEPVWPDDSVDDELVHIAQATPGQRALYVVTLFIREVDNGGLDQFFFNSSGIYAGEVVKSLRMVHAHDQANAFQEALQIFPGARPPLDQRERRELLARVSKENRIARFGPLERRLYGEDRLKPLLLKYINGHRDEFFADAV